MCSTGPSLCAGSRFLPIWTLGQPPIIIKQICTYTLKCRQAMERHYRSILKMASCCQYVPPHCPNTQLSLLKHSLAHPVSQTLGFARQENRGWELEAPLQTLLMQPWWTHLLKFSLPLLRRWMTVQPPPSDMSQYARKGSRSALGLIR